MSSSSHAFPTNIPPLPKGVFSVSASSLIDASIEDVWNIILDFPSYHQWNPFVRKQVVTDSHKNPLPDQTVRPGVLIYITVNLPPTLSKPAFPAFLHTGTALTQITVVDGKHHRASWVLAGIPKFLLTSERWQALSVDAETGKTRYETKEVFSGIFAYLANWFVGENLKLGFHAQAEGLKKRAERLK